jgi:PAS domain S-box-containing protein
MPTGMATESTKPLFACQPELVALYETLVDVMFCAKDRDGTYVEVNSAFVRRTGKTSKRDVIGALAHELFIDELAERYEEQDGEVFATGKPLHDQLEVIRRTNGELGWYLTTKLPVRSQDSGAVVGLVSLSRDLRRPSSETITFDGLQAVVDHVRAHIDSPVRLSDLAAIADCTETQLERRMRKVFGVTPTQYVVRVRVETAAAMLRDTSEPIASIATRCGFYDQPDFTRRFARLTNETPAQFRAAALSNVPPSSAGRK